MEGTSGSASTAPKPTEAAPKDLLLEVDKEALEERVAAQSEKHKKCSKEQRGKSF